VCLNMATKQNAVGLFSIRTVIVHGQEGHGSMGLWWWFGHDFV